MGGLDRRPGARRLRTGFSGVSAARAEHGGRDNGLRYDWSGFGGKAGK